ncbi:MAG: hypothetical protein FJW20_22595 [Acidimicrobiia bacterium]|nr:hypothetical protein [Acidimicrobiia bacterium]
MTWNRDPRPGSDSTQSTRLFISRKTSTTSGGADSRTRPGDLPLELGIGRFQLNRPLSHARLRRPPPLYGDRFLLKRLYVVLAQPHKRNQVSQALEHVRRQGVVIV